MGIVATSLTNRLTKPFVRLSFFQKFQKCTKKILKTFFRAYFCQISRTKNLHFYTYETKMITKAKQICNVKIYTVNGLVRRGRPEQGDLLRYLTTPGSDIMESLYGLRTIAFEGLPDCIKSLNLIQLGKRGPIIFIREQQSQRPADKLA